MELLLLKQKLPLSPVLLKLDLEKRELGGLSPVQIEPLVDL